VSLQVISAGYERASDGNSDDLKAIIGKSYESVRGMLYDLEAFHRGALIRSGREQAGAVKLWADVRRADGTTTHHRRFIPERNLSNVI